MSPALTLALALFAAGAVATQLFAIIGLTLAPFARVLVQKASFGIGPRIHTTRLGATILELKLIPLLSSVTPFGASPLEPSDDGNLGARPPPPKLPWFEAPRLRRALAFLAAPHLTTLAIASAVLGPTRATRAVAMGVVELFSGALGPFSTARTILDTGASVVTREGFLALWSLALCKYLSANLLALPTDLAFTIATSPRLGLAKARAALMLLTLPIYATWVIAWIAWIAR